MPWSQQQRLAHYMHSATIVGESGRGRLGEGRVSEEEAMMSSAWGVLRGVEGEGPGCQANLGLVWLVWLDGQPRSPSDPQATSSDLSFRQSGLPRSKSQSVGLDPLGALRTDPAGGNTGIAVSSRPPSGPAGRGLEPTSSSAASTYTEHSSSLDRNSAAVLHVRWRTQPGPRAAGYAHFSLAARALGAHLQPASRPESAGSASMPTASRHPRFLRIEIPAIWPSCMDVARIENDTRLPAPWSASIFALFLISLALCCAVRTTHAIPAASVLP